MRKYDRAKRPSIKATAREQLLRGRTDAQTFAILRRTHGLPEEKRWYVRWNRNLLIREGTLKLSSVSS